MALKKEAIRATEGYEFRLTHADVVDLMNDDQVQLNDGNVSEGQVFEFVLIKGSGAGGEIRLRQFKPSDTLIFRFNVVTQDGTAETVNDLDVVVLIMHMDEAWLEEVMGYMADYHSMGLSFNKPTEPDNSDFEDQLEYLQSELRILEDQLEQEQREHDIQQQILAELARERANLGENYRVNWIEEGF